ncbi:MAG: hypothetical protein RLY86_1427 [Pseudomonadota bacterium]|jgi:hypothetical protein
MTHATGHVEPVRPIPAVRFASATNAGIGVWLILAPFILSYQDLQPALWNDIVVGIWLLVVGALRAVNTTRMEGLSWANAGFGLWLVAAPFLLGYSDLSTGADVLTTADTAVTSGLNSIGATWNDIVVGLLTIVLAVRSASATRGWRAMRDTTPLDGRTGTTTTRI